MAVRATDQITLVDVTDAYSVILTNESHTFQGSENAALTGTTTTAVIALMGGEQKAATVVQSEVSSPAGVSVAVGGQAPSPVLSISVGTSVTQAGKVSIPVHIDDVVVIKEFTFSIAFKGAKGNQGATGSPGPQGNPGAPGEDALTLEVTSSNGNIFKNSAISTVLTAHIFRGATELSSSQIAALGTVKWYKDAGASAVGTGTSFTVSAGAVSDKALYTAKLEG